MQFPTISLSLGTNIRFTFETSNIPLRNLQIHGEKFLVKMLPPYKNFAANSQNDSLISETLNGYGYQNFEVYIEANRSTSS